ncbi:ABC-type Zn2+ transport system, periplasmic component/surface adhesin [Lachnospiraceae bacterium JC7]|nr:ABC-type Zn2+ transport system, periplasmic component/surface adhesin [Lachnospiraceae bacterium JC7]
MEMIIDAFMDALIDTIKLVPFLLVTYMAMEYLEHKTEKSTTAMLEKAGRFGPLIGGAAGMLPQCGFSAAASSLFAGGVISVGTLIAVFLSTSDEMLPIFISEHVAPKTIIAIMLTKMILGIISGFTLDIFMHHGKHTPAPEKHIHDLCEHDHCACDDEDTDEDNADDPDYPEEHDHHDNEGHEHHHSEEHSEVLEGVHEAHHAETDEKEHHENHGHEHSHDHHEHHEHEHSHDHHGHHHHHKGGIMGILHPAFHHTFQITVFIFIITFVITLLVEGIGRDAIGAFLSGKPVAGVFLSGIIGLIPNCAASVSITELYLMGILDAGQMMAGLMVGAGVGLLVLFRTNYHPNENLRIAVILYAIGVFWGLVIQFLGVTF